MVVGFPSSMNESPDSLIYRSAKPDKDSSPSSNIAIGIGSVETVILLEINSVRSSLISPLRVSPSSYLNSSEIYDSALSMNTLSSSSTSLLIG